MARPKTGDKPQDLRKATVDEVAAIGSTAVSVNKIAARAGLSVGTIYRYHRSKDELLFAVFLDVKRDIHDAMMSAAAQHQETADRLRAMWFALVDYGFRAPRDFQMVELMSTETRIQASDNEDLKRLMSEVLAEIQQGIDDGTLVKASVRTIETVLASPAITLTRRVAMGRQGIDKDEVERIFSLVWRGIAHDQSTFQIHP
ncbi:TetR/AcrR family transcriptional regulator [uncultured Roseibium sp.]|uniref:TetR/AcrR family transcriptional regulator n=1 Tax=uncultured Roseibium sp. TaxID=1936171 RepID=UPI002611403C|nr:TetR/AcrR family transcriptional regulator [uncultured Roseibium sp.]